jgi:outer membrane protein TolC
MFAKGAALKQNPQVQVANLNVAVSQESQVVARSALLAQANFTVITAQDELARARADLARATGQMELLYTK